MINEDVIRITNGTFTPFANKDEAIRMAEVLNANAENSDEFSFEVIPLNSSFEKKINNINSSLEVPLLELPMGINEPNQHFALAMTPKAYSKNSTAGGVFVLKNDAGNLVYATGEVAIDTNDKTLKSLNNIESFIATSQNPFSPSATIYNVHGESKITNKYMTVGSNGYKEIQYANFKDIYRSAVNITYKYDNGGDITSDAYYLKKAASHTIKNLPKRSTEALTTGSAITSPDGLNLGSYREIGTKKEIIDLNTFKKIHRSRSGGDSYSDLAWAVDIFGKNGSKTSYDFDELGFTNDIYKGLKKYERTSSKGKTISVVDGYALFDNIMKKMELDEKGYFEVQYDNNDALIGLNYVDGKGKVRDLKKLSVLSKEFSQAQQFMEVVDSEKDAYNRILSGVYSSSSENVINDINKDLIKIYMKSNDGGIAKAVDSKIKRGGKEIESYKLVAKKIYEKASAVGYSLDEKQYAQFEKDTRNFLLNKGLFDGLNNVQRQSVNTSGTVGDIFGTIYGAIKANKAGQREAQADAMVSKAVVNIGGKNVYLGDIAQSWTSGIKEYEYKKVKFRNLHAQELFNQTNENYYGGKLVNQFMSQRNMMVHVYNDAAFQDSNIVDATLALENTSMVDAVKPINIDYGTMNKSILEGIDENKVNEVFKNGLSNENIYVDGTVENQIVRRLIGEDKYQQHINSLGSFEEDFKNIGKVYEGIANLQGDREKYTVASNEAIEAYNNFFKKHGIATGNDGIVNIIDPKMVSAGTKADVKGANYGFIEGFNFTDKGIEISTKALWVHGNSVKFMNDEVKATTQSVVPSLGVKTNAGNYIPVSGLISEKATSKKRMFAGTMLSRQLMTMGIHGSIFGEAEDYAQNFDFWKTNMSKSSRAILEKQGIKGHDIFSLLNIDMNFENGTINFLNRTTMEVITNHKSFGEGANELGNSRYNKIQSSINKHFSDVFGKAITADNGSKLIGETVFGTLDESYYKYLDTLTSGITDANEKSYIREMADIYVSGEILTGAVSNGKAVESNIGRAERALKVYSNIHLMSETKKRSDAEALKLGRQGLVVLSENGLRYLVDELEDKIVADNSSKIEELYALAAIDGTEYEKGGKIFKQIFGDVVDLNDDSLKYNVLGVSQTMDEYMQSSPLSKILEKNYDVNTGRLKTIKARIEGFDGSITKIASSLSENKAKNYDKVMNAAFAGLMGLNGHGLEGKKSFAKASGKLDDANSISNKIDRVRQLKGMALETLLLQNNSVSIEEMVRTRNYKAIPDFNDRLFGFINGLGNEKYKKEAIVTFLNKARGLKNEAENMKIAANIYNKAFKNDSKLFKTETEAKKNFLELVEPITSKMKSQYDLVQKAMYTQMLALSDEKVGIEEFDIFSKSENIDKNTIRDMKQILNGYKYMDGDTGQDFIISQLSNLHGRNAYSLKDLAGIGKTNTMGFIIDEISTDEFGQIIYNKGHASVEKIIKLNQELKLAKKDLNFINGADGEFTNLRGKLSGVKESLELISKDKKYSSLKKQASLLLDMISENTKDETFTGRYKKFVYGSAYIKGRSIDDKFGLLKTMTSGSLDRLHEKLISAFENNFGHNDYVKSITGEKTSKKTSDFFADIKKTSNRKARSKRINGRIKSDYVSGEDYSNSIIEKYESLKLFLKSASGNDKWGAEYKGKKEAFDILKTIVESHIDEELKIVDESKGIFFDVLKDVRGKSVEDVAEWLSNSDNYKKIENLEELELKIINTFTSLGNKKLDLSEVRDKASNKITRIQNSLLEAIVSRTSKLDDDLFRKGGKFYKSMTTSFEKSAEISPREGSIISTYIKNELEEILDGKPTKETFKKSDDFFTALEKLYGRQYSDDIKDEFKTVAKSKEIEVKKAFVKKVKERLDGLSGIVLGDRAMYAQVNMDKSFGKFGVSYGLLGRNPHQYVSSLGGTRFVMLNDDERNLSFFKHMFGDNNTIKGNQSNMYFVGKRTAMAKHGDHDGDKFQMMLMNWRDFGHKGKEQAINLVKKTSSSFELLNMLADYKVSEDLEERLINPSKMGGVEKRIVEMVKRIEGNDKLTNSQVFDIIKDDYYTFKIEHVRTNAELIEENEKHSLFGNFRTIGKKLQGIKDGTFTVDDLVKDITNLTQDEKLRLFIKNAGAEDFDNFERFFEPGANNKELINKIRKIRTDGGNGVEILSELAKTLEHDKHTMKWNDLYFGEFLRSSYTGITRTGGIHHALSQYRDATMRAASDKFWNQVGQNDEGAEIMKKVSRMYAPSATFGELIDSLAISSKISDGSNPYEYLEFLSSTVEKEAFKGGVDQGYNRFYQVGEYLRKNTGSSFDYKKIKSHKGLAEFLGLSETYSLALERMLIDKDYKNNDIKTVSNIDIFRVLADLSSMAIKTNMDIRFGEKDELGIKVGDSVNSFKSKFFRKGTNFMLSMKEFFESEKTDDIRHESWMRRFFKTSIDKKIAERHQEHYKEVDKLQESFGEDIDKIVEPSEPIDNKIDTKNVNVESISEVSEVNQVTEEKPKKKRGRPLGSKNKPKVIKTDVAQAEEIIANDVAQVNEELVEEKPKKKRGRPLGSKNKPKIVESPGVNLEAEVKREIVQNEINSPPTIDVGSSKMDVTTGSTNDSEILELRNKVEELEAKLEEKNKELYNEVQKATSKAQAEAEEYKQYSGERLSELKDKNNLLNVKEKRIRELEEQLENRNKTIEGIKERAAEFRKEITEKNKTLEAEITAIKNQKLGTYTSAKKKADDVFENVKKTVKDNKKVLSASLGVAIIGGALAMFQKGRTVVELDINEQQYERSQGSIYRNLGNYNINTNIRSFY